VLGNEAYSDTNSKGSQSKAGVVQPHLRGEMPDPAFEAPTYPERDLGLFPHGKVGSRIMQMWDQNKKGLDRKDLISLLPEEMAVNNTYLYTSLKPFNLLREENNIHSSEGNTPTASPLHSR